MSVGAGSIKRAASAVNAGSTANMAVTEEVKETEERSAKAEALIQKAESKLAARKAVEGKPMNQKTSNKPVRTEMGSGKTGMAGKIDVNSGKAAEKADVNSEKTEAAGKVEAVSGKSGSTGEPETAETNSLGNGVVLDQYKIYGVGQELPVYLL